MKAKNKQAGSGLPATIKHTKQPTPEDIVGKHQLNKRGCHKVQFLKQCPHGRGGAHVLSCWFDKVLRESELGPAERYKSIQTVGFWVFTQPEPLKMLAVFVFLKVYKKNSVEQNVLCACS